METRSISIKKDLYERLEKTYADQGFGSVDEYAEFLLEEALKDENGGQDYSSEEEKKIQKRLQDLGYID